MDVSLSKLREIVKDREAWRTAVHGVTKSWMWLLSWTTTNRTNEGLSVVLSGAGYMGRAEGEAESVLAAFFSSDYSFKQFLVVFVVVIFVAQSLSRFQLFMTQWTAALQASLPFTISWSLIKLMFIELMMPSNYLIFCCLLLLLPWIFPSVRVLSNESTLSIMWSKYSSFSFSISPSSEYSRLISFRIDWFDLLAVQGTLNSLLEQYN